jgi:hypothetical protein
MTYDEAARFVAAHYNSYSRLPGIIELQRRMLEADWLRLLGENWSHCDNIVCFAKQLRARIPLRRPLEELMTRGEWAAYGALPPTLTVYRGAGDEGGGGFSWTLDRAVAVRFPRYARYRPASVPTLFVAEVDKLDILALKLDRDEAEVIVFKVRLVSERPLEHHDH